MKIGANIPSLQAYTALSKNSRLINKSMQRLSSGIRINSVSDDAAGMAISNKMKMQIRSLEMANRNSNDGTSLIQTAEGALQEVHNILHRIRELSIQAANDTMEPDDREKSNKEVQQLLKEIDDISFKTEFNTIKLLNGGASRLTKLEPTDLGKIKTVYVSENVDVGNLSYQIVSAGLPAYATSTSAGIPDLSAFEGEVLRIDNMVIEVESGDNFASFAEKIVKACDTLNLDCKVLDGSWNEYFNGTKPLYIGTKEAGSTQSIKIQGTDALLTALGMTPKTTFGTDAVIAAGGMPPTAASSTGTAPGAASPIDFSALNGQTLTLSDGTLTNSITFGSGETAESIREKINTLCFDSGLSCSIDNGTWEDYFNGTAALKITSNTPGAASSVAVSGTADTALHLSPATAVAGTAGTGGKLDNAIFNATVDQNPAYDESMLVTSDGNRIKFIGADGNEIHMDILLTQIDSAGNFYLKDGAKTPVDGKTGAISAAAGNIKSVKMLDFGTLKIQVGANKDMEIDIQIPNLDTTTLNIQHVNIKTEVASQRSIVKMDKAISMVSIVRATLGAYENRLQHTIASLDITTENAQLSLSRIYDTDVAWEMTQLSTYNVISQAGMSIMAQANQRPQQILQLLN